ncbi:MATE family efflux transporter [Psychrosphaera haliotis]|nr:MATE family efflux transporter [Psychrosphaera haliotis]
MYFYKTPQFLTLYRQTMPLLVGLLAIMGSQLIDSAFIGQLGAQPLAALGYSIPIYQVVIGIQVGLGIAATASISNALGSSDRAYAKSLGSIILLIGTIVITLLCIGLWLFQEPIAIGLGAEPELFPLLNEYWFPWLLSCWLGAILYFGYSICRSHGETRVPGKVMVITSVLNVVLDPLFIFTFEMGLAGAAWATCMAFLVGCFIIFQAILNERLLTLIKDTKQFLQGTKAIIRFTIPAMVGQFIPPVAAIVVTIIIASFGDIAVGAWGLANRIEYLAIIVILALTMALPPMIGVMRGQRDYNKIRQLVEISIKAVILLQLLIALLLAVISMPLAALLTSDGAVANTLSQYLWLVPLSYGALGVCMICVSASNAMGAPTSALITSIVRLFVCYLPVVWFGAELFGLTGLFIGSAIGNLLSGFAGWVIFMKQFKKQSSYLAGSNA